MFTAKVLLTIIHISAFVGLHGVMTWTVHCKKVFGADRSNMLWTRCGLFICRNRCKWVATGLPGEEKLDQFFFFFCFFEWFNLRFGSRGQTTGLNYMTWSECVSQTTFAMG